MRERTQVESVRTPFVAIGGVDLPIPPRGEFAAERSIFDDPAFDDLGLDE